MFQDCIIGYHLVIGQEDAPINGAAPVGNGGAAVEGADGSPSGTIPPAGGAGTKQQQPPNMLIWMLPLAFVFLFMMWQSSSSRKKETRRRAEMLDSLQKHDKVQTIGGVIGSIVEVRDTEIIVKVDESNNIKMHFAKTAIQGVVAETGPLEASTPPGGG